MARRRHERERALVLRPPGPGSGGGRPLTARLALAELPPGSSVAVEAFGTTVAVFNVGGRLFAVENSCPHHGGPLCKGRVSGALLPSAPYEYRYEPEVAVLTCPWHGWEFELETGKALFDPAIRVPCFDARVEGEEVVLRARPSCRD